MKKNLLSLLFLASISLQAQVPNGEFENWTNGNPDDWFTNNVPGFAVTVTPETPAYSGTYALKGEVILFSGSPLAPLLASTDAAFNGFAVSQSYANFSFYYKMLTSGSTAFAVSVVMYDAAGNFVGNGGNFLTGTVSSYTLMNIPIYYINNNPAECVITFLLTDTLTGNPAVGNYFTIDQLLLSGTTSIHDNASPISSSAFVMPNPAGDATVLTLFNTIEGTAELFLYDIKGSIVKKISAEMPAAGRYEWMIPVSDLANGLYHARVVCGEKQWQTKIVKQ